ncbi:MAG: hydroxymethylbilane synthase [Cloacibacillus sp.]
MNKEIKEENNIEKGGRKIRFGSRKSDLALAQTKIVMDSVAACSPEFETELVPMETTGDKNMKPFSEASDKFGIKGLFTQELEEALLSGAIDVAVHSLKDMPVNANAELPLIAYSKREDPRDAMVLPSGHVELAPEPRIGCSSARRRVQLSALYPTARIEPVRGNINTRLRKLDCGEYDALVLAAAGLKRLGMEARVSRYFEPEEMVPAPGQGILACQGRAREDYHYLEGFRDRYGRLCAEAERAFSAALGGGCTAPVGAYARVVGDTINILGFYADESRGVIRRDSISGDAEKNRELGRELAERLLKGAERDAR